MHKKRESDKKKSDKKKKVKIPRINIGLPLEVGAHLPLHLDVEAMAAQQGVHGRVRKWRR